MKKPIYVTGHKNPDSDSICSSIAYSYLKNQCGSQTLPIRLGELNNESKYILQKFKIEVPRLMHTAKCTLAEIDKDEAILINKTATMKEALDVIIKSKNKGLFVVNQDKKLEGILSISNLTHLWVADETTLIDLMSRTPLENIIKTTQATLLNEAPFHPNGKVHLLPSLGQNTKITPKTIVIVGNHPDVQRAMIEQDAALIIICGENWVDSITLSMAKEKQVPIIHTPLSAITLAKQIYQSPCIQEVMTKDVVSFSITETVDGASQRIAKTRFRTYPVLDENDEVVGAISRYHLFNYEKKKFILVDHNEKDQSINDIEFGEIVEIVDHHRLGGIITQNPIQFTNQIVGSTCTIVYGLYKQYHVELPKNIAGILQAGILSDTLNCKSPTTTIYDQNALQELSQITHIDSNELSSELVLTTDSLLNRSYLELMYDDFKEFRVGDTKIGIGQVVCRSEEEFKKIKDDFLAYLDEQNISLRYDVLLMLFTKPTGEGSYFLYTGKKSWVIDEGFKGVMIDDYAPHFISRKKQILPVILEILNS
ncbi:MAG: putative manganese-dependent inorganic diphosphatase [Traorella sp.]